jgi:hypothetical protein
MIATNMLSWNVRGLNVAQQQISLLTLQETKLDACDVTLVAGLCGARFDFCDLPASNSSGVFFWHGIVISGLSRTSLRDVSL